MNFPTWNGLVEKAKYFGGEDFFKNNINCKKYLLAFYFIGIVAILLYYLPQIINVNGTVFRVHDYLEQDFVNIHLNAKYLFSPRTIEIKELFGGTFRGSIQIHGLFYILLYKIIQGSVFLAVAKMIVATFGFSGMYLLFDKLYSHKKTKLFYIIAASVAFLYAITPQLLHGVTAFLLPWIVVIFYDIKFKTNNNWLFFITFFASIFSSFIYSGFVFCGFFFLLFIIFVFNREYPQAIRSLSHGILLFAGNIFTFAYTIISISEVSSRSDWGLSFFTTDFLKSTIRYLTIGNTEVYSCHHLVIYPLLLLLILSITFINRYHSENKLLLYNIVLIVTISLLAAFWQSAVGILCREYMGGLFKSFQLNRITMLLLSIQHILLFVIIILMCKYFISLFGNSRKSRLILYALLSVAFVIGFLITIYAEHKIGGPKLSLNKFFQTDMMKEVDEYIGKSKEEYRVVSFGYNPGIALYHGFFCLDGYSTNYRLSYKNDWRKVICNEIQKDDYLKNYFNCWGGRVYLFSPSLISKSSTVNLPDFNYEHLRKMGCNYIFSKYKFNTLPEILTLEKIFHSKVSDETLYLYRFIEQDK